MLHGSVGLAGEGTTFAAVDIPALLSNARARHASTGTDIGTPLLGCLVMCARILTAAAGLLWYKGPHVHQTDPVHAECDLLKSPRHALQLSYM